MPIAGSRLAGADEDRTLAQLRGLRSDLIDPAIAAHHGRVVKRTGDGILIEFRTAAAMTAKNANVLFLVIGKAIATKPRSRNRYIV